MNSYRSNSFIIGLSLLIMGSILPLHSQNKKPVTGQEARMESWEQHVKLKNSSPFKDLKWRVAGPEFMGGRIETIASHPDEPYTIYAGAGSGSLWKTINHGTTWESIFDDQPTFAMGCIAIAPSDPDILWLGTGEVLMARSSYSGLGVFKSDDAGKTWQHLGLEGSYHVPRIVIDPINSDIVYAAALGHNYSFNEERGIYKTTDGWPGMKDMNTYLMEADQITGPYRLISYLKDFGRQAYFVNLPSRFIDSEGKKAWMSYSANFNPVYFRDRTRADPIGSRYAWNLQEFLLLDPERKEEIEGNPQEQIDPLKKRNNIALRSRVTVSSVHKKHKIFSELSDYFGAGAVDGVVPWEGETGMAESEKYKHWVSDGEKTSAMIRLNWDSSEKVSRVWLFDHPGMKDQVTSGMLVFSDGSTINVGALPNDAISCKQIVFDEKEITWLAFLLNSVSETTRNAGLAEFAVFAE